MDLLTIVILGVGLSMDAFAVSICKGLAMRKVTWKEMGCAGLWFGLFQGLMPLIGYLLGGLFAGFIEQISGWIAFILLALIGGNMIREALGDEEEEVDDKMTPAQMFPLAVATSIDALAVGITFSVIPVEMFPGGRFLNTFIACLIITLETGVLSGIGVKIGGIVGAKFKNKAQIAGGAVLILIGLRILLQSFGQM